MQRTIQDYNEETILIKKSILLSLLKKMDFMIEQFNEVDNKQNDRN